MRMGITGLPVIFDLPPAMAVRRAEQFKKYVHPVLQAYCAKCHNADYDGKFQLVPVKTTKQRTPDALRANLDATLRLIDPEYPAKSDLLSSTLRPHGIGGKARPIFSGSNDRAYQILAAWVTSLRPSTGSEPSAPGHANAGGLRRGVRRRSQPIRRRGSRGDRPGRTLRESAPALDNQTPRGSGSGREVLPIRRRAGDGARGFESGRFQEFPLPYMLGGPQPKLPGSAAMTGNGRNQPPTTKRAPEPGPARLARPGPGGLPVVSDGADPAAADLTAPAAASKPGTPAMPKKPVKIDPKILEKLLQRNVSRTDGQ